MRTLIIASALLTAAAPAAAQSVTYNSSPASGFFYGAGNNYTPANAAVLTNGSTEFALRFHQGSIAGAPASDATGTYSFALGTSPINFDYSLTNSLTDALITVTNIGTGQTASFNPLLPILGNSCNATVCQNSENLSFRFLLGSGFTPNVDSSYSVTLSGGGNSLTTIARLGAGASSVAAVPEPATWALMLMGFGGMGLAMRRQRRTTALAQVA